MGNCIFSAGGIAKKDVGCAAVGVDYVNVRSKNYRVIAIYIQLRFIGRSMSWTVPYVPNISRK
jgi:hypothetical protein